MYSLSLNTKSCISCGICADVCSPKVIELKTIRNAGIEGSASFISLLDSTSNREVLAKNYETFPFLKHSTLCDGCMVCVKECPCCAISIT